MRGCGNVGRIGAREARRRARHGMIWIAPALVTSALALAGCHTTKGVILVGQPEVFTRERLIEARFEDYEWLRGKLDDADEAVSFQGFVDQRILDITIAKVEAEYGMDLPGGGTPTAQSAAPGGETTTTGETTTANGDAGGGSSDDDAGSSGSTQPLLRTQTDPLAGKTAPKGTDAEKTKARLTRVDQLNDQLAYRSAVRGAMRQTMVDDSHDLTGGMLYDLKFDVTIQPGDNSQRNAIVLFKIKPPKSGYIDCDDCGSGDDDMPARSDRSDLYRIKIFEYNKWVRSVASEMNVVSLELQRKLDRGTLSATDTPWLVRAVKAMDDAIDRLSSFSNPSRIGFGLSLKTLEQTEQTASQEAIDARRIAAATRTSATMQTAHDKQQAANLAADAVRTANLVKPISSAYNLSAAPTQDELDTVSAFMRDATQLLIRPDEEQYRRAGTQVRDALKLALALGVFEFYSQRLEYYHREVSAPPIPFLDFTESPRLHDGFWYLTVAPGGEDALCRLNVALLSIENRYQRKLAIVVDTQPKEYAQNISDVGAGRYILNFLAAFQGNVSSNLTFGAEYERFLDEQIMLQAVKRRALAIGFNNSNDQFGYILGPQFEIEKKNTLFQKRIEPAFKHRATRYTVGATLIAPAWMPSVEMEYWTCWVDAAGRVVKLPSSGTGTVSGAGKVAFPLTMDYRALTRAVMFGQDVEPFQPSIHDIAWSRTQQGAPTYSLKAGEPGEVLVHGRELWRNPQVFVGSQRANRVTVLADMHSLHARFEEITWTGGKLDRDVPADLTVVTSYGFATLDKAVRIAAPEEKKPPAPPQLTVAAVWTVKDAANVVEIPFKMIEPLPTRHGGVELHIRDADTITGFVPVKADQSPARPDEVVFRISDVTRQSAPIPVLLGQSRSLETRVMLRANPAADPVEVKVAPRARLAYFSSAAEQMVEVLDVAHAGTVTIKADRTVSPAVARLRFPQCVPMPLFDQYVPAFTKAVAEGKVDLVLVPKSTANGAQTRTIRVGSLDPVTREMRIDLAGALTGLSEVVGGNADENGETVVTLSLSIGGGDVPGLTATEWKIKREKKQ